MALLAQFGKRLSSAFALEVELSLEPAEGNVTVLFGPSGSGKTSVLRCLAGLERPDAGRILFNDEIWFDRARGVDRAPQERRIGFMFQEGGLFPHLNVAANVAYGARWRGGEHDRQVQRLIDWVGLRGFEGQWPPQLSGGQRQRVALARALASEPRLLLLDEPLAALDQPSRAPLQRELRHLLREAGLPAIVVTHDRHEALALGDRLAVLVDGRIRQAGPVPEVFSRPADATVARTVGTETVVPGRIAGPAGPGLVSVAIGAASLVAVDPGAGTRDVLVCIRAEDVIVERGAPAQGSARNRLAATLTALLAEGALWRASLQCGFELQALLTRPACEDLELAEGASVTAVIKATAIHLVPRDAPSAGATQGPDSGTMPQ